MRGRMGTRGKRTHRGSEKPIPGCPPTSVSHMRETVTGNSLSQQLQGEMIKEWRNANQKSFPLSFHTSCCLFFIPSLNTKQTKQLIQPLAPPFLRSWGRFTGIHTNNTWMALNLIVSDKILSLDHRRYLGMLPSLIKSGVDMGILLNLQHLGSPGFCLTVHKCACFWLCISASIPTCKCLCA